MSMRNKPILAMTLLVLLGWSAAQGAELPPDADAAPAALAASPRHGEWVDVPMPGAQTPIRTWVVYPERADRAPVVIVIHEIFGLTDWVRSVADALASEGFIAVAPDLLSGMGPDGGGTESLGDRATQVIRRLTPADQAARLNAAREYALTLPAGNGRVGCVGFCWGGSASFLYATQQPKLNAAVVYYGTAPDQEQALAKIACPVLGLYGGDDARVTATVEPTAQQMKQLGKSYEVHIYKGAGHGFLRQQDGRDGANLEASKQAWARTLAFFREHLETSPAGKPGPKE